MWRKCILKRKKQQLRISEAAGVLLLLYSKSHCFIRTLIRHSFKIKMTFYSSISGRNHEMWFLSQETLRPKAQSLAMKPKVCWRPLLLYPKGNFYSVSPDNDHFKYASINGSKSPSITAPIFPVSCPERKSFTKEYGWNT